MAGNEGRTILLRRREVVAGGRARMGSAGGGVMIALAEDKLLRHEMCALFRRGAPSRAGSVEALGDAVTGTDITSST